MYWLIVRCDMSRKEEAVAEAIRRRGFAAVVPTIVTSHRTAGDRRTAHRTADINPLLPRRLFAMLPETIQAELVGIRYNPTVDRDSALQPYRVPHRQVMAFMDYLTEINSERLARIEAANRRRATPKTKWQSLGDLQNITSQELTELLAQRFGPVQSEAA